MSFSLVSLFLLNLVEMRENGEPASLIIAPDGFNGSVVQNSTISIVDANLIGDFSPSREAMFLNDIEKTLAVNNGTFGVSDVVASPVEVSVFSNGTILNATDVVASPVEVGVFSNGTILDATDVITSPVEVVIAASNPSKALVFLDDASKVLDTNEKSINVLKDSFIGNKIKDIRIIDEVNSVRVPDVTDIVGKVGNIGESTSVEIYQGENYFDKAYNYFLYLIYETHFLHITILVCLALFILYGLYRWKKSRDFAIQQDIKKQSRRVFFSRSVEYF